MKTFNNSLFSPFAAWILKLVGTILIISFLLDFIIALFPFIPQEKAWQISFANQLVDRGITPMVGLALLFTGFWIDNNTNSTVNRSSGINWQFWTLLLSSILGLLFLLIFPLHINNVLQARTQTLERINQEATQAQNQLQTQVESQKNQLRTQISTLLQNERQLNQALQSQQVPEQFKNLLRQAQANPQGIEQLIDQQLNSSTVRNQVLAEIQTRKQEVEKKAQQEVWQSGVRISIRSLLLSIGYIALGWTGLRRISVSSEPR